MLTDAEKRKLAEIDRMARDICNEMEEKERRSAASARVAVPLSENIWEEGRENRICEVPIARACRKCVDAIIAKVPDVRDGSVCASVRGDVQIDGNSYGFTLKLTVTFENFVPSKRSFTYTRLLVDTDFKFDDFSTTYRLGDEKLVGGRLTDRQIYGDRKKNTPAIAIGILRRCLRDRDLPECLCIVGRRMLQHSLNPKQGKTKDRSAKERLRAAVLEILREEGIL